MTIEVTNLYVRYGSVEAVRGISFQVSRGEICGYLGPNGAGKSSTVNVLAGLLSPAAGTAEIAGFNVTTRRVEAQRRLGFVPEGAPAYPLLTPFEFLGLSGDLHEVPPDVLESRRAYLLERFDLVAEAHRLTSTLSKGQRQRLVLAAALLHEPEVLILDEPLSGLDAEGMRIVKNTLRGLAEGGCAVLFCSHTLETVERLCSRVIIIAEGRVVADERTPELLQRSPDGTLESVFLELTRASRMSGKSPAIVAVP
jgi:ABC-2 type transport system ATP-binding protein